ncbi:MAG: biotin/lipoyl-containing protein, partial [Gammaproteobacteria bacterium]
MSRIHAITMPKWGIEMQEGTINGWHATVGQVLGKTEPLLDVETEKIVNTVETPVAGTLRRIVGQVGDTLSVGSLIGLMADAEVTEAELDQFIAGFKGADASFEPVAAAAAAPAAPAPSTEDGGGEARVS